MFSPSSSLSRRRCNTVCDDVASRRHHFARQRIAELDHAEQHLLLVRFRRALLVTLLDQQTDLILCIRERWQRDRPAAEHAHDCTRRQCRHTDQRMQQQCEQLRRPGSAERDALRVVLRDHLRHLLAEHDMQKHDGEQRDHERNHVRHCCAIAGDRDVECVDPWIDARVQRALRNPADADRRECDAQLRRRNERLRCVHRRQHTLGAPVASARHRLHA
jgi:hypothetical protein